jgi:hypothetical protein
MPHHSRSFIAQRVITVVFHEYVSLLEKKTVVAPVTFGFVGEHFLVTVALLHGQHGTATVEQILIFDWKLNV